MKKQKILFLSFIILIASFSQSFAQLKIGHINRNELILSMPESDSAQLKLQELNNEYTKINEELQVDYNIALENYENEQAGMTTLHRQTKEKGLNDMMKNIQSFVAKSREDLQNKEQELYQPLFIKAQDAIQEVSDEHGFDYILDTGTGAFLTIPKDQTLDLMNLVKTKLDISIN